MLGSFSVSALCRVCVLFVVVVFVLLFFFFFFFFKAEDGIRDLVRSRGLGNVYRGQWQRWLEKLNKVEPQLVISDVMMPKLNGYQVERMLSLIQL